MEWRQWGKGFQDSTRFLRGPTQPRGCCVVTTLDVTPLDTGLPIPVGLAGSRLSSVLDSIDIPYVSYRRTVSRGTQLSIGRAGLTDRGLAWLVQVVAADSSFCTGMLAECLCFDFPASRHSVNAGISVANVLGSVSLT